MLLNIGIQKNKIKNIAKLYVFRIIMLVFTAIDMTYIVLHVITHTVHTISHNNKMHSVKQCE